MKKSALIILLVTILSVSLFAAVTPSGVDNSLGTILNWNIAGSETDLYMTAVASGGVVDLSADFTPGEIVYNNILPVNIDLEMENIENVTTLKAFTLQPENYRGGGLHYAIYYQQIA